jgi:hypothetical protein
MVTVKPAIYRPSGPWWRRVKTALELAYVNWHLRAEEGKPADWYVQMDQMEGE